ncbi:Alpha/Beta hydrolase protein [Annulohypoxylon maeteangense]|uniref:Alpha/Beta hydrolase protein n=1 Tax=Annulohypoxylon maeteangense TaxID=1927788 RepID=UPI0020073B46|nr:Alpha/Beta hydrolase protein [Annulohypoxylon maeteangense]KAI0884112.1 Alpha/Beta hydrolase protein [Annulohypoxylon maeteangense]
MSAYPTIEGEVSFEAPNSGRPCKTWYKIVGDLEKSTSLPLVALHGGPGAGHEYLTSFTDLIDQYNVPIVFYDQIGCGHSTHLKDKIKDESFWTFDLFIAELDNLIDHLQLRTKGFYLLGQSWGGMLAGMYAARRPEGLKKLVLCGAPASFPLFVEGGKQLRAQLPEDVRKTLDEGDRTGNFETDEYEQASMVFYKNYVCRVDPMPEPVQQAFANLKEDPTTYLTMQGPSEIVVTGNLRDWDGTEEAKNINVDTLLLNGQYDEVSELCVEPWFRSIPRVKWIVLENSSHMGHWEVRERFMKLVGTFITSY